MTTRIWILLLAFVTTSGCANMMAERFADNLGTAILSQNDPETVRLAVPAYLIMLDSLTLENSENPNVLRASASLYSAYASLFAKDESQAQRLSLKAKQQAREALCQRVSKICISDQGSIDDFNATLQTISKGQLPYLYTYGAAWAAWIQANKTNWEAMADVPKVQSIMRRVVEIDESYEWGRAHVYLGVINSQLPPALGGKPEVGLKHFEKAIELSNGEDLVAKVELARNYARLMFDQSLHDNTLTDVINSKPSTQTLALSNALAKQTATELLKTSPEYFEE